MANNNTEERFLSLNGLLYLKDKLKSVFQNKLISGTNIKTINNQSILGSGNIDIQGGGVMPTIGYEEIIPQYIYSQDGSNLILDAAPYEKQGSEVTIL